ncbi:MAG: ATP-binding cassette domain-containing protein [Paracoccaceae bacterium]|nr:ATP-binding cassette domain-containing protein [Paracoccaceae bacterium]
MREAGLKWPVEAEAVSGSKLMPLTVRGLSFCAGGRRLIDHISLTLDGDGVTMVMGPNGAGKSLFLRLIHGLIPASEGEIKWGGALIGPEVRRHQALVFQKPVLLRRSVAANVDFVLKSRGRASPEAREALLERVGLGGRGAQAARLLSGGEQQRLALARALATEPEVLLLDEPTASLDPASAQAIETIVADVARSGTRVIFVTHDVGQARRLGSDVVFLARGRIAEHTPADAFFDTPSSREAEAYLSGELVL